MPNYYRHLMVAENGDVSVVHLTKNRVFDTGQLDDFGRELMTLIVGEGRRKLILNLSNVTFLSSAALGKVIALHKMVKAYQGRMILSNIRPELHEAFVVTKLDLLFEIRDDEQLALSAF